MATKQSESSHVEPDLLAYLDGELAPVARARVAAHLACCPSCAEALADLRALRGDLGVTLDAALAPERLSREADARIRAALRPPARPWLWRWRGALAQVALALLLVFFSVGAHRALGGVWFAAPVETLVLGRDRFAPGSRAALRVVVRSAKSAVPLSAVPVAVSLVRSSGAARQVYAGLTDAAGTADVAFAVPQDWAGEADLVVETRAAGREGRVVRPVTIARSYKLYLSSDKPAYQPGQTVHLRVLALDALDLQPVADSAVTLALHGPAGAEVARESVPLSGFGVAALDVPLPEDAPEGAYALRAQLGDTVSERAVTVAQYRLPAFHVSLETARDFYAPGERALGAVEAAYFFQRPVAGATVVLRGYTDAATRDPLVTLSGETDEDGRFAFALDLPPDFATEALALFDLEVEVTDAAGRRAGRRHQIPVAPQPLVIKAVPESGELKPGVENTVFVMTAYPDGAPAEAEVAVAVGDAHYDLETGPHGLAQFRFTPGREAAVAAFVARAPDGAEARATVRFDLDAAPQTMILRAERAVYEVGDTLRLEALVSGEAETVYLDVVRARQMVAALSAPVVEGRATFALDLDAGFVGALELRAYALLPGDAVVEDARLVVVDAPRGLAVDVRADRAQYHPGDVAHVEIETRQVGAGASRPVPAALALAVVDASVYALDTLPPGFARAYVLLEQEMLARRGAVAGLDVPALLDAQSRARRAQDLAAQAAWAGAPGDSLAEPGEGVFFQVARPLTPSAARAALARRLVIALALLSLAFGAVVLRGLAPWGVLPQALRRLAWGLLAATLLAPLLVAGGVLGLLLPLLGTALLVGASALVALLAGALLILGWARRSPRLQLAFGLVAACLLLGALLIIVVARGGDLPAWHVAVTVAAFLALLALLALLGQGLVVQGQRGAGWLTTALALLLVLLALALPASPALRSRLTRVLSAPGLYVGPLGWLSGCATPTPEKIVETVTVVVEKTVEVEVEKTVEVTRTAIVEKTTELEPTGEFPVEATPTPAPTATPQPAPPTATPALPAEPYPLRHIFPETLYWAPEARTDAQGRLTLDLPLADALTAWRLTALASTVEGDLGSATYDIVVVPNP